METTPYKNIWLQISLSLIEPTNPIFSFLSQSNKKQKAIERGKGLSQSCTALTNPFSHWLDSFELCKLFSLAHAIVNKTKDASSRGLSPHYTSCRKMILKPFTSLYLVIPENAPNDWIFSKDQPINPYSLTREPIPHILPYFASITSLQRFSILKEYHIITPQKEYLYPCS